MMGVSIEKKEKSARAEVEKEANFCSG